MAELGDSLFNLLDNGDSIAHSVKYLPDFMTDAILREGTSTDLLHEMTN